MNFSGFGFFSRSLFATSLLIASAAVLLLVASADANADGEPPMYPCDASTGECEDCVPLEGADGRCVGAMETYEVNALTGDCSVQPGASPPQPVDNCEGEGTTGWSGAYCSTAGISPEEPSPPICSRLWAKKDRHSWQAEAKVEGNVGAFTCKCIAKFLTETSGAQCVQVCGQASQS